VVRANAAGWIRERRGSGNERDISHSSAERIIIPDSTTLADYLLNKTANLIETMFVYPKRMMSNLESTRGLVFSGSCCLTWSRVAFPVKMRIAWCRVMLCEHGKEDLDFHELIVNDPGLLGDCHGRRSNVHLI